MIILKEQLIIDKEVLANFEANQRFMAATPEAAPMPPIAMLVDAQGHWNYDMYWRSGQKVARSIARWIATFLPDRSIKYLEWGCGPARVLRHLPRLAGRNHEYTGSDYNHATIEWCRKSFPKIKFVSNDLAPPLPFDEGTFDFVYSRSVFTHLTEENGLSWLEELKRILAPGGIICFSTCGDAYIPKISTDGDRDRYLSGHPVVSQGDAEGQKLFSIKHPPAWVRDNMLKGLELLEFVPGEATQDVWLTRMPATAPRADAVEDGRKRGGARGVHRTENGVRRTEKRAARNRAAPAGSTSVPHVVK